MAYSIGLDIGGTHIHGIIMDEDGTVIKKIIFETHPEHSRGRIIRQIISSIKTLNIKKSLGIGLGIAGITDQFVQTAGQELQAEFPGFDLGHVQQVLDEP